MPTYHTGPSASQGVGTRLSGKSGRPMNQARWRRLSRRERRQWLRRMRKTTEQELEALVHAGLLELSRQAGLVWVYQRLEAEADAVAGAPKGKHRAQRRGRRHGYEVGSVVMGGVRVAILRPRVRSLHGEELVPPTYRALQDEATLSEAVLVQSLAGVAMRRYADTVPDLLGIPDELPVTHASRSTVSRHFIAQTGAILAEILRRPLSERYLVVFLDGLQLGDYQVVAAVGVTEAGEKRVLGLWEGVTENREVCQALVEDLAARGLSAEQGLLVVIDGSKALAAAVRAVWSDRALIQRCVCHKARNVLEKLPRSMQPMVKRRLARAWGEADAAAAALSLQALADRLEEAGYSQAAASLREGLEETLTCQRLQLPERLRRSLRNTNIIESIFARHEEVAHRVKRWRHGFQALRWAAASLLRAEKSLRALPAAAELPRLAAALEQHVRGQAASQAA